MSRPEVRIVVVYEDEPHGKFVRQLTRKLGLRPERLEPCGGCVNVLDRFVVELKAMRHRMKYQHNLGLMVVIDADKASIAPRIRELEERLRDTGGPRGATERIAYIVPALEIENWYVHLCVPAERPVDEGKDYKPERVWKDLEKDLAATASQAVDAWVRADKKDEPASLTAARLELDRL
ncbi:hypothetical protein [Corallococcus sp. AS-1-12]|uniref:hypothetical protein n=1 Tax=Corallococcus sp. AS-1-12 TaxID=2874598 RepID=UPI001CC15C41|nr:hypothetical protein [Corallococcus sp. AS-1-12]MBZ4330212.1 hypothetical protein [Corallococcus sp. AS-1-12]